MFWNALVNRIKRLFGSFEELDKEWEDLKSDERLGDVADKFRRAGDGMGDFVADNTSSSRIDRWQASGKLGRYIWIGMGVALAAAGTASYATGEMGYFGVVVILEIALLFYANGLRK
jgi:hypothetical protein